MTKKHKYDKIHTMKSRLETHQQDPSQKHANRNRRAKGFGKAVAAVALAGTVVAGIKASEHKPNVERVEFSSEDEANNALKNLVKQHGDKVGDTPKKAEAEINGSLEASIPFMKQYVGRTLESLVREHEGGHSITVDGLRYGFDITSFADDEGVKHDVLHMNEGDRRVYLSVTHKEDGDVVVLYRDSTLYKSSSLSIEGDDIVAYSVRDLDEDGDYSNETYRNVRRVKFSGRDFEDTSNAGPDLEFVTGSMDDLDEVLNLAQRATAQGAQEY